MATKKTKAKTRTAKKTTAKKTTAKKAGSKKSAKKKATTTKAAGRGSKLDFDERLAALPSETAELNPDEPVDGVIAMAIRLAELGKSALPRLKKLPDFDPRWATELSAAALALGAAEHVWVDARSKSRAGISPKRVKEAESLKSDIVASGRYLLRADPVAQQQLDEIMVGTGIADLAGDLRALGDLLTRHASTFATDDALPASAAASAATFASELAVGIDPSGAAVHQAHRNRLFWLTKGMLGELRAALRFVWRKEPTKTALLGVTYVAQLKRAARKKQRAPTPA